MAEKFDPYFEWLGISPAEQPADYYRLLGVATFEQDTNRIRNNVDELMEKVRSHQNGKHSRSCQRILTELSAAKSCLLNPKLRRIYDAKLAKIINEKKLPDLAAPGKLLPDQSIPDHYDPFANSRSSPPSNDPLSPVESPPIWPIVLGIVLAIAFVIVIILMIQLA